MTKLKADKLTSTSRLDAPIDKVVADILEVATREFASLGLAGARIEKIQEQTKTSKRMIYYHFGSKEGLYKAVIENAFLQARKVDQGFDPFSGSPEEALKKIVSLSLIHI